MWEYGHFVSKGKPYLCLVPCALSLITAHFVGPALLCCGINCKYLQFSFLQMMDFTGFSVFDRGHKVTVSRCHFSFTPVQGPPILPGRRSCAEAFFSNNYVCGFL